MREEVLDMPGRDRRERGGEDALPGCLNGHRAHKIRLGSGEVKVRARKVTGTTTTYRGEVLPAFALRSEALDETPPLSAEGLSTRDFKRAVKRIFLATCLEEAKQEAGRFIAQYVKQYAMACETLCRDLYDCLTFCKFPQAHWKRLRMDDDPRTEVETARQDMIKETPFRISAVDNYLKAA